MADTWSDVVRIAEEALAELLDYSPEEEWTDAVHEAADGSVPVYTSDRFAVAAGLPDFDFSDPGIAEGVTNLPDIIGILIYDKLTEHLFEAGDPREDS